MKKYYIGYDIGAISVNRAVVDEDLNISDVMPYSRHYGEPVKLIEKDMGNILKKQLGLWLMELPLQAPG